jgi:FkbM family methyltransferase
MIGYYPIMTYFRQFRINCVLDVGANDGSSAVSLRQLGYRGKICSFEPQSKVFEVLERRAKSDPFWSAYPYGLGDKTSKQTLNISGMGASSSFLKLSEAALNTTPNMRYVDSEQVETRRLDECFEEIVGTGKTVFLKIDTQGFERQVLDGASGVLDRIDGLQLELSWVPQYAGEKPAEEMIAWIRSLGFTPYWFLHGHRDFSTMQLIQFDGLFFRS